MPQIHQGFIVFSRFFIQIQSVRFIYLWHMDLRFYLNEANRLSSVVPACWNHSLHNGPIQYIHLWK